MEGADDRAQAFFPRKRTTLFSFAMLAKKSYLLIYLNFTITCLCLCVCVDAIVNCMPDEFLDPTVTNIRFFLILFWNPLFIVSSLGWFCLVKVFPLMNNYFLMLAFFLNISHRKCSPLRTHTCLNRSWGG